ncbi:hypothetical protein [Geomonas anaerohicana]|uniref:Uncharacterized protein n=1 Tax=Geomonas anaerohicana TaxID=2798583 RepID=A0ABS0YEJ9_9BACT|nr:hypothetical protein [Geomonas anaerohicana]MBJ6750736.1 hypothetical protein [Geomonas anaerohicana]
MEQQNKSEDSKPENGTIKLYQDIVDRAHKEVEAVRKVYYWLSGLITVIIAVGTACFTVLIVKDRQELRSEMEKRVALMKADLDKELELGKAKVGYDYNLLERNLTSSVQANTETINKKVNSRIEAEFDNDNIQQLVKARAEERIDKVADGYISSQIDKRIVPQMRIVEAKIVNLQGNSDFNFLASAAQGGDRFAFEALKRMASNKMDGMQRKATEAVSAVRSSRSMPYLTWGFEYPWKPGSDPDRLNIEDIKKEFASNDASPNRIGLIDYVKNRENINKKDKLKFLYEIISQDKSIDVVIHAASRFNEITGQNIPYFEWDKILDWYPKHVDEIK